MTDMAATPGATSYRRDTDVRPSDDIEVWRTTETKSFFKTSEFFVWALAVAATVIATYAEDSDSLQPRQGWLYIAILSASYMLARGVAKSGSYEPKHERRDARWSA
jgi:hypothetical protein